MPEWLTNLSEVMMMMRVFVLRHWCLFLPGPHVWARNLLSLLQINHLCTFFLICTFWGILFPHLRCAEAMRASCWCLECFWGISNHHFRPFPPLRKVFPTFSIQISLSGEGQTLPVSNPWKEKLLWGFFFKKRKIAKNLCVQLPAPGFTKGIQAGVSPSSYGLLKKMQAQSNNNFPARKTSFRGNQNSFMLV